MPSQTTGTAANAADISDDKMYLRIAWRLMPVLLLAYVVAFLDRVNIGFAKLQMQQVLGLSEAAFGLGAGLMFVGYSLLEVPSNLMLERIGARKTLLRIMLLWGGTAMATALVTGATQFYIARFLLGAFEAGLFPGVILYLTLWFPEQRRGRANGIFMSGALIGSVLIGPLSGMTMKFLDKVAGLGGWQWLYITQGLPAILLGFVVYLWLDDSPAQAAWLTSGEKRRIAQQLAEAPVRRVRVPAAEIIELLTDPRFLGLVVLEFLVIAGSYTMAFWAPSLIRSWGVTDMLQIGMLLAVPNILGVAGIFVLCRHSDLRQERRWHFVAACLAAACGLWLATVAQGRLLPSLLALCLATVGFASALPILITAVTEYIPPQRRTIGIPLLTGLGILGGFAGPMVAGIVNTRSGDTLNGMRLVVLCFILAASLMPLVLPVKRRGP